jgi:hypothetical protein
MNSREVSDWKTSTTGGHRSAQMKARHHEELMLPTENVGTSGIKFETFPYFASSLF